MSAIRGSAKQGIQCKALQERVSTLESELFNKEKALQGLTVRRQADSQVDALERQVHRLEGELRSMVQAQNERGYERDASFRSSTSLSVHQHKMAEMESTLERETRLRALLQKQLKEVENVHEQQSVRLRAELDKARHEASEARTKAEESRSRLQQQTCDRDEAVTRLSEAHNEIRRLEADLQRLTEHAHKCRDEAHTWIGETKRQFEVQHESLTRERDTLLEQVRNQAMIQEYTALEQHRMQRLKDELQDACDSKLSLERENASLKHRLEVAEDRARSMTEMGPEMSSAVHGHPYHSVQYGRSISLSSVAQEQTNTYEESRMRRLELENRSLSQNVEMLTERLSRPNFLLGIDEQILAVAHACQAEADGLGGHLEIVESQMNMLRQHLALVQTLYERT